MEGRWDRLVANLPQWAGVWSLPEPMQDRGRTELIEIMETHHDQNAGDAKTIMGSEGMKQGSLCGLVRLGLTTKPKKRPRGRASAVKKADDMLFETMII